MVFIIASILCFLTSATSAMEHSFDTKIDPDIKRIIHKEFPAYFHTHLNIIDEIQKESEVNFIKYANKKNFIFHGLADYLYTHGLKFLKEWQDNDSDIQGIRKICNRCMEDDLAIYAIEENDIFLRLNVMDMRLNYRFTLEEFTFYTFFQPCFTYYSVAKRTSNMPYEYEQRIETAKRFFRKSFPNTTLVENGEKQKELASKECLPAVISSKTSNGIACQKVAKMVRSLSGKNLSSIRRQSMIIK